MDVRSNIELQMRMMNLSLEDAAAATIGMGVPRDAVDAAVEEIHRLSKRQQLLDVPAGVTELDYQRLLDDLRGNRWYTGPMSFDKNWHGFNEQLIVSMGAEAARSVDQASSKVVSLLADPGVHGLKKKGLILGYVQSGKTANFAAVAAKAADAGFRLFIVLSGIHNSLRAQTQVRLEHDLIAHNPQAWVKMTTSEEDFGRVIEGGGLLASHDLRNLVVIKKNASRLEKLADWLESIPEPIRHKCPAIIIDDEADQATPNSLAGRQQVSKINALTKRVFELLPTATYLGYTATPFANVLMNPADESDLYPSDFIIDLPRPGAYFGAERLFGRSSLDDEDSDVDGLDMIREITESDLESIVTPKGEEGVRPAIPDSLAEAIRWFVLTVAVRRVRGQGRKHTSMLIHTSHRVDEHDLLADLVKEEVAALKVAFGEAGLAPELESLWLNESQRVGPGEFGNPQHAFDEVLPHIEGVLEDLVRDEPGNRGVIVDNGQSDDRLNYGDDEPTTVIAVGGQTLSRGLTLEGLTVSWFARTSKAYDTLLQMGRWFGYRVGYEDLPRVWMTTEMKQNFHDLATIEQELRDDIKQYTSQGITPRQLGLRIRQHPTMAITAAGKMYHAQRVNVSYAGTRRQTFRFDHQDHDLQRHNLATAKTLVSSIEGGGLSFEPVRSSWVARDVPAADVVTFLENFKICEEHVDLQAAMTVGYLQQRTDEAAAHWNVAIMGSGRRNHRSGENEFTLGTMDLGLKEEVGMFNRAPLDGYGPSDPANIKALMSNPDRYIDLSASAEEIKGAGDTARRRFGGGRGLLLVYPIAADSQPTGRTGSKTRTTFTGAIDMLGLGIVFPELVGADGEPDLSEHDYVGLPAWLMPTAIEAEDESNEVSMMEGDDDPSAEFDGNARLSEI